jgi:L-alanine-DL-glutamate epimerase-like enolase superfamily enzyme
VVEESRAVEKVRVQVLQGRMEWDLGNADAARAIFDKALADPRGKAWEAEIRDLLSGKSEK